MGAIHAIGQAHKYAMWLSEIWLPGRCRSESPDDTLTANSRPIRSGACTFFAAPPVVRGWSVSLTVLNRSAETKGRTRCTR